MAFLHHHQFLLFILLLLTIITVTSAEHDALSYIDFERNLSNVTADRAPSPSVPIFFHVPKSGGTSMKFFAQCLDLVLISESSRQSDNPASLEVRRSENGGGRFVNVDVSTRKGISEAQELGFLDHDHIDEILFTPFIQDAATKLVNPKHPGALFALLRHPVERAVSKCFVDRDSCTRVKRTDFFSPACCVFLRQVCSIICNTRRGSRRTLQSLRRPPFWSTI
jgi:hypothetical protein